MLVVWSVCVFCRSLCFITWYRGNIIETEEIAYSLRNWIGNIWSICCITLRQKKIKTWMLLGFGKYVDISCRSKLLHVLVGKMRYWISVILSYGICGYFWWTECLRNICTWWIKLEISSFIWKSTSGKSRLLIVGFSEFNLLIAAYLVDFA